MRIPFCQLENFGRHKSVRYDLDAAVVGVMGVNGTGKSTLLKALKYGLTGETDDNISSFIRQSEIDPPKSAEIIMGARKHGVEGLIERKIGKVKTSRKFTWEGQEYTKATEVDALLADLLGASKRAITNIVFIPQGELDKVLFGTQGEREVMFMRLLLLDHLEEVAKQLEKSIAVLASGLTDHSIALDEVMAGRRSNEEAINNLAATLSTARDWTGAIELMQQVVASEKRTRDILPAEIENARRQLLDTTTQFQNALAISPALFGDAVVAPLLVANPHLTSPPDYEALELAVEGVRSTLQKLQEYANWAQKRDSLQRQQDSDAILIADAKRETNELEPLVTPASPKDAARIALLEKQIQDNQQLQFNKAQLAVAEENLKTAVEEQRINIKTRDEAVASWETRRAMVAVMIQQGQTALNALQAQISLHKAIADSGASTDCKCPTCKQSLPPELSDPDAISKLTQQFDEMAKATMGFVQEKEENEKKISEANATVFAGANAVGSKERSVETAKSKIEDLLQVVPDVFVAEDAQKELNQLSGKEAERSAREIRLRTLNSRIQSLQQTQEVNAMSLRGHLATAPTEHYDESNIENDIKAHKAVVDALTPRLTILRQLTSTLAQSKAESERLNKELTAETKVLDSLYERLGEDKALLDMTAEGFDVLTALRERQSAYQQLLGEKRSLDQQSAALVSRQREIELKIELNRGKEILIAELKQLKGLFSRDGLPMIYCRKKFQELAVLTQQFLAELGSKFIVQPDPEKDVTFQQKMLDEENSTWLDQSKLSGGQRVRLSIAFLLAVQRLIIPETGLLVLDEPSNHLDSESRESLAGLLRDIGDKFASTEMQIIVCDHSPELAQAFQKTIRL